MAKYTELFADYLKDGGALPSVFSSIIGFEDLFKGYYCDKEIGFETEILFAIKLETYANIYVPMYAQRISALATALTNASNPVKVHYERYDTTINAGAQKAQSTDLPINASTATPSSVLATDAYVNTDARVTNREESGFTVDEAYRVIDKLNEEVRPLIRKLLDAFKPCFMGVY